MTAAIHLRPQRRQSRRRGRRGGNDTVSNHAAVHGPGMGIGALAQVVAPCRDLTLVALAADDTEQQSKLGGAARDDAGVLLFVAGARDVPAGRGIDNRARIAGAKRALSGPVYGQAQEPRPSGFAGARRVWPHGQNGSGSNSVWPRTWHADTCCPSHCRRCCSAAAWPERRRKKGCPCGRHKAT